MEFLKNLKFGPHGCVTQFSTQFTPVSNPKIYPLEVQIVQFFYIILWTIKAIIPKLVQFASVTPRDAWRGCDSLLGLATLGSGQSCLQCTALTHKKLNCTALYCNVLHRNATNFTALYCIVLYCSVLYCHKPQRILYINSGERIDSQDNHYFHYLVGFWQLA